MEARLDDLSNEINAWRPHLEGRVNDLQTTVADLQRRVTAINEEGPEVAASTGFITIAPATCSMEGLGHDTAELRPATTPTTAPTVHTTTGTADIDPVPAAAAASDGTLDGQAISGVASTPATCSMDCLPQQPMVSLELAVSSPSTLIKYGFSTNCISVVVLHPALTGVCLVVLTPMIQMQQLYGDSELVRPSSTQHVVDNVPLHRPMPWPSLLYVSTGGDDTRPLPWPSLRKEYGCRTPRRSIMKPSQPCSFGSTRVGSCAAIEFQISDLSFVNYAMHDASNWPGYFVNGSQMNLVFIELKLVSIGSAFVAFSTVLMDSSNFAALPCDLGVDTTACSVSWSLGCCLLDICPQSSTQSSTECYSAIENVAAYTVDCHLMDSHCRTSITFCLSSPQEPNYYFCSSELKESLVQILMSSSYSVLCDEWVLSPWDPGLAVISDFTKIFYSKATFDNYVKKLMLQGLNDLRSNGFVPLVVLVSSGYNTPLPKSVSSGQEQLTIGRILLDLQHGGVDISKCNITIWSRYMIQIHLTVGTHLAVRNNYSTDRQLDLGTKSTWYPNSKYSMMVVNNSATPIIVKDFQGAYVSVQMEWDTIVSMLSCGPIHLGKLCPNWKLTHSAIGQPDFLLPSQSVAVKNKELWWFMTALLTEIAGMFNTVFSRQLVVVCSVQSILLLNHAYQCSNFGWEQLVQITQSFASGNLNCLPNAETVMDALVAASSEVMFMMAFGGGQRTFQGERHMLATDQNKELRFPWDPGVTAAALKCMDLWWFAAVIFTGHMGIFSLDMDVTCSVQPNLLLTRVYRFACDPSEGSCSCITLHNTISLAGIGSLDWAAHQAGFSLRMNDTYFVQTILLPTHAYELGILASTLFTFAWRNWDCIFRSSTARCALQSTSSELLVFIVAFGGGQGIFHVEMRIPCSPTCTGNLLDAAQWDSALDCLFNAIKGLQKSWNPGISQFDIFNDHQLNFFCDLGGTKKRPLSWDRGGKHMTSLDWHIVLQFPWDPGIAAAAWGQAAFQGGRGVRDPSYTSAWAWAWLALEQLSWAWALPSATTTGTTSTRRTATRRPSCGITDERLFSVSLASSLYPLLLPVSLLLSRSLPLMNSHLAIVSQFGM